MKKNTNILTSVSLQMAIHVNTFPIAVHRPATHSDNTKPAQLHTFRKSKCVFQFKKRK